MKILTSKTVRYSILALLSLLLVTFIILFVKTSSELHTLKAEYDKAVDSYENKIFNLTTKNLPAEKAIIPMNFDFFIQIFKEKGLSNPVQDIISDLLNHTELIPYEPKPGGTANFYEKEVWILNEKWVMASITDGHWGGYLLLEYDITEGGNIKWRRIEAMR